MLALIGFIITISLLVFIHEFGHYYTAKKLGVKVEEFSIGFGKELYSIRDKDDMKWKFCLIPLGGFVKMYGDANPSSMGNKEVKEPHKAFYFQSPLKRFLIISAGPLANYLLAFLIICNFYFFLGKTEVPAIIGEVIKDSPAEKAGLQKGDQILAINDKIINNFLDLQKQIIISTNQLQEFLIDRAGANFKILIKPEYQISDENNLKFKKNYIGIKAQENFTYIKMGVVASLSQALQDIIDISGMMLKGLGQMLSGQRSMEEIYGPVFIAKEAGKSLAHGPMEFLLFIAMLSINLGLFNLLPIPILDGGHLFFIICEVIARKPISAYMQSILLKVGILIIIFLIVISFSNDIKSLMF